MLLTATSIVRAPLGTLDPSWVHDDRAFPYISTVPPMTPNRRPPMPITLALRSSCVSVIVDALRDASAAVESLT